VPPTEGSRVPPTEGSRVPPTGVSRVHPPQGVGRTTSPFPLGRRRPSGEPPPLPRPISRSTHALASTPVLVGLLWVALALEPARRLVTTGDLWLLSFLADARADVVTEALRWSSDVLSSPWTVRVVAWTTLAVLVVQRRFQHLFVYLALALVTATINSTVSLWLTRMRPAGFDLVGRWEGFAHPSVAVAGLGFAGVGALYCLVPPGTWRVRLGVVAAVVLAALAGSRLHLALDHPSDVAAALVTGVTLPLVAFRVLLPDDVFPVTYRRGRRAHLDVSGPRGAAIRRAVGAQLGLTVREVEPFALAGSAGSTPLRLRVERPDGQKQLLFAKLYAGSHLRADRWYKLARAVRYGRLEDELPFNAVRRLVGYEDHMLRLMRDAGVPTASPVGLVEITPEREYLMVTEFLDGAVEIGDATVTDEVIDDGLRAVRRMWEAGLAHRDVKPSNVLVRDGRVHLIDVAFGEVRPTPWRQAVDLANMMLTLALGSSPEQVYRRAQRLFAPDEIAEAFAASRGVTIPAQLRARICDVEGEDLLERFRSLAPARPPVAIQRWSLRRIGLTVSVVTTAATGAVLLAVNLRLAGLL
jgi:tRNA A-37 threonylcarbamoyl transferase component Bud32/membrane-associated phospholipid phosphatase